MLTPIVTNLRKILVEAEAADRHSSAKPTKFVPAPPGMKSWATPSKLPDEPHRYFISTPTSKLIPVDKLQTIRARPEGIANAEVLMANAFNGRNAKRKPISLKANADGSYTVLDGNSTTAIAKKHGWSHIVADVTEGVSEETLGDFADDLRRLLFGEEAAGPEWKPGTPYEPGMGLPAGWRLAYGKYPYLPGKMRTKSQEPTASKGEEEFASFQSTMAGLKKWIEAGSLSGSVEHHVKEGQDFLHKHEQAKAALGDALTELAPEGAEVSVRVKDLDSALGKLVRKAEDAQRSGKKSKYDSATKLGDGTGGRIICNSVDDVKKTVDALKKKYKVLEVEDNVDDPKGGNSGMGYRSIHVNIIDKDGLQKEIQVRTSNEHKHAAWAHDAYKPHTEEQRKAIASNADTINAYGRAISDFFYAQDTGKKAAKKPDCPPVIQKHFGCL